MRYEIYEGAFANTGDRDTVIFRHEGDWDDIDYDIQTLGMKMDKYMRFTEIDGVEYVDFGSWSTFIRIYK